jgi:hypothetical protein
VIAVTNLLFDIPPSFGHRGRCSVTKIGTGGLSNQLADDRVSDADTKIFRQRWPARLVATAVEDHLGNASCVRANSVAP